MARKTLYFATNRNHIGNNRFRPEEYGKKFSDDGTENLRFGKLTTSIDKNIIKKALKTNVDYGPVDGGFLAGAFVKIIESKTNTKINAFRESITDRMRAEVNQKSVLGSKNMFEELKTHMMKGNDVLIFIHGFNVSWAKAVGTALAIQETLNRKDGIKPSQKVKVVLFTWPSDGLALPYVSYKSDRTEAAASGYAVGRGILKVRNYLTSLNRKGGDICKKNLHILCHSMGNYVLQNAMARIDEFTPGSALPRIFEHIFMCAPDVDEDVFEPSKPLSKLHQMCRSVSVYHNRGDAAMVVSDFTKGNPDRLGANGAGRPSELHHKIHQVDCTDAVHEIFDDRIIEHSYYLNGEVNRDIRLSLEGLPQDSAKRPRQRKADFMNSWILKRKEG